MGISYVMFKLYYETGVYIMRRHTTILTLNDPFHKETFLCRTRTIVLIINVWVSSKTQQGTYEKFSNTYMSVNTGKIRTKLFNTTIIASMKQQYGANIYNC